MLSALVRFSIQYRSVVVWLAITLVAYGIYSLGRAGLDIFPEFSPKLVIIQTEAPGFTAEQVEVLVTQPIETALGGIIGLDYVHSESIQGLSIVTAVFEERTDIYRNRNQVAERLAIAEAGLPAAAGEPVIAPLASSSATVRTIGITSGTLDAGALRDVTERIIVPRVLGVAGIADVNVFGGDVRALLIQPRLDAMIRLDISMAELLEAAREARATLGAGFVEDANQQIALVGVPGDASPDGVAANVVRFEQGTAITIGDVANVRWGALPPISRAQVMGEEAVVMMIIGQLGANTLTVSNALQGAFAELEPILAQQGIDLYADLFVPARYITTAIGEIGTHLMIGAALVLVVLVGGLYNLRTALISAVAIPLSLLSAVIVLNEFGVNLNVLIIGGLAIALGEVVDDAIIDTENIFRRLRLAGAGESLSEVALKASLEVRGSVVYATFIVALVFVPLLTLGGVTGRLFAPLGAAYILAVVASLLVAITVTPALCVMLLARTELPRLQAPVFRRLNPPYTAAVRVLAGRPPYAVAASALCIMVIVVAVPGFGSRFLPDLREGHFIVHTTGLPGTSLDESIRMGRQLTEAFLDIDGVISVSQWAGRAERGADTYGSHYSEYEVALEPMSGTRQQQVLDALRETLAGYPGITFEANSFLTERIDETISGYTAPVVVNIFGDDLEVLDATALEVAAIARSIPGATNVRLRSVHGTPNLTISFDTERMARAGVRPAAALAAVKTAYAGERVGEIIERNRRYGVLVILDEKTRSLPHAVGALPIDTLDGAVVALRDVADVLQTAGRYNILHREALRLQVVTMGVLGRDVDGFLSALREQVLAGVEFPRGVHVEFTGAAVEQRDARRDLLVHALLAGLGVLILIYIAVGSMRHLWLILLNLPFSLLGGVVAVLLDGGVVSMGSVVGFVTLFGITVRNSIMLVSHYQHLVREEGCRWELDTVLRGARERLPAISMTALVTALAMLPLTIDSDNPGREIMGPMAAIIVGGLVSSTLLNLLVMPALLYRYGRFDAR